MAYVQLGLRDVAAAAAIAAVVVALYTSKTLGSFKKLVGPGPVSRQHSTGTLFF